MIFIIDDNSTMATCIGRACGVDYRIFSDAISAMQAIAEGQLPSLIFLDILLSGPDGFTFLNELASYRDTAKIPIVIVSSFDFSNKNLENYGVIGYLNKDTMLPEEIRAFVERNDKSLETKVDSREKNLNLALSAETPNG